MNDTNGGTMRVLGETAPLRGSGHGETPLSTKRLLTLSLMAMGIVFGDIGTSPLYAIRVCFSGEYGISPSQANVLGVLSLIFWALIWVISVKYLVFVMRADNHGEGGIIALTALLLPKDPAERRSRWVFVGLGLFGGALLFGDGMITPAISVLSAVEGLDVAAPFLNPYVVPVTILLLIGLFIIQKRGTARVGGLFGPVVLFWFLVLAILGIRGIATEPGVIAAINPLHAVRFFLTNKIHGFLVLGTVFLVVTGGEALYADMGHFGRKPIRFSWFTFVLPALLLNYFGQGALIIRHPESVRNPFFLLAPSWALYPMVLLATAATIIASQAVISGSFSMGRQLIQLGFSPRLQIRHTSSRQIGQIYIPAINWTLMVATIGLVLGFGSSDHLAAAYGVAVTTTMVITTLLFAFINHHKWHWPLWATVGLMVSFLVADIPFFAANIVKVDHGGWFPLLIAAIVFTLTSTWKRGREILYDRLREGMLPIDEFVADLEANPPVRVPGTAVFMTGTSMGVPHALLHNLKHNHVLHERVILLTAVTEEVPRIRPAERADVTALGQGIFRIIAHYGFMESPDIPNLFEELRLKDIIINVDESTFFLGSETLIPTERPGMAIWREWLFAFMSRNAQKATAFFNIPANRVMEIGVQIEL
jgi:KUP system potassium uptake protein